MNHRQRTHGFLLICALAGCGDDDAETGAPDADVTAATAADTSQGGDSSATDATNTTATSADTTTSDTSTRPSNTSCTPWSRPLDPWAGKLVPWPAEPVALAPDPVVIVGMPGVPGRYIAANRDGKLVSFSESGAQNARVALDIATANGAGISDSITVYGFAVHPDFPTVPHFYVLYRKANTDQYVIARLDLIDTGFVIGAMSPFPAAPEETPGGWIGFSPIDKKLYVSVGAKPIVGSPSVNDNGFGKVWRVDVIEDPNGVIATPIGNPFPDSARPLTWAAGFNDPRASFDRTTGDLWVADISTNAGELDVVQAGLGYGAPCFEGPPPVTSACGDFATTEAPRTTFDLVAGGPSLVAGYVYRGTALPGLVGTYVFAKSNADGLLGLVGGNGAPVTVDAHAPKIRALSEDISGEILAIDTSGKMYKLGAETAPPIPVPATLADIGCFPGGDLSAPASGVVPYQINVELWSDGASKHRYFAIPDGTTVEVAADGELAFPIGTMLIKTFALNNQVVEVRFLVRHEDGDWAGYSYAASVFGAAGLDLMPREGGTRDFGGEIGTWNYPSRSNCTFCHSAPHQTFDRDRPLGLDATQLDREGDDQLDRWNEDGYLSGATATMHTHAALPPIASNAPLQDRARAYLDANCSHCHQPGGPGRGPDFRYETAFASASICNQAILGNTFGLTDPKVLVPGDVSRSLMSHRMHVVPPANGRMPLIGTVELDPTGTALIDEWIGSLSSCP